MIKFEKIDIYGWEAAIRGMRNPKNSWDKTDSYFEDTFVNKTYVLGENDLKLATTLAKAGTEHGKFLRMINVTLDITAPLYWWKEFDTYKVGTVADSCSTMHKIHAKPFTIEDFSHEHLEELGIDGIDENGEPLIEVNSNALLLFHIKFLNLFREKFIETKDKKYWWQLIQLLPTSYNQKRTVQLNYQVLSAMYHQRKEHKLDEWHDFCRWIETLPYAKELIIKE